jgi:hypothetical protein
VATIVDLVDTLTWRQVDFGSVVLAGIAGGYLMALVGLWAGRVPHLVAVDIADYGRRYMVSDRASAWLIGLFSHLFNSVLLVLLWAMVIVPNLDIHRVLSALIWGEVLAIGLRGNGRPLTASGSWAKPATPDCGQPDTVGLRDRSLYADAVIHIRRWYCTAVASRWPVGWPVRCEPMICTVSSSATPACCRPIASR